MPVELRVLYPHTVSLSLHLSQSNHDLCFILSVPRDLGAASFSVFLDYVEVVVQYVTNKMNLSPTTGTASPAYKCANSKPLLKNLDSMRTILNTSGVFRSETLHLKSWENNLVSVIQTPGCQFSPRV